MRRAFCAAAQQLERTVAPPPQLLSVAAGEASLAAALSRPPDAARLLVTHPVPPGGLVSLLLGHTRADVAVRTGPAGEATLEAAWPPGSTQQLPAVESTKSGVELREPSRSASSSSDERLVVTAWIPERFASLRVSTRGACVVDRVTEAGARVTASSALLGSLKCTDVRVTTVGPGDVTAATLSGSAVAVSCGGALAVRRLVARYADVVAHTASLDAVLADTCRIEAAGVSQSGGASSDDGSVRDSSRQAAAALRVGTLRVAASATLRCRAPGAALAVSSVQGEPGACVNASTAGGPASLGLEAPSRRMRTRVATRGGGVGLGFAPEWDALLRVVSGCVGGKTYADAVLPVPRAGRSEAVSRAGDAAPADRGEGEGEPGDGGVDVDAGTGDVHLAARSWLEGAIGAEAALRVSGG